MATGPVAVMETSRQSPIPLSGGSGFQSTKVMARSPGSGGKISMASALAPPGRAAAVTSNSNRRQAPVSRSEAAICWPFSQTLPSESRLNSLDAPGTVDEERLYRIVDALAEIAAQRAVSISQAALNWVTRKPGVDTVIIGARNEQQLRDNLAAATWTLTDAEVERLDEVSALPLPYPYWHQQKFAGDRNPPAKHVR